MARGAPGGRPAHNRGPRTALQHQAPRSAAHSTASFSQLGFDFLFLDTVALFGISIDSGAFFFLNLPLRQIPPASIHWLVSSVGKAPENLSIPAPSQGAAKGTVITRDWIDKGQRGFSVETSKLEAVYFQPGFWGNLCRHLRCLAWGAPAPSIPDSEPVTGKGTPDVFLQILPSYWRGQKLS